MTRAYVAVLVILLASALSVSAQPSASPSDAAIPTLVNFSGVLTGSNGKPLTTITGVTFSLYAEQNGGAPLWLETQNVQPDKAGNYSVMLGSTASQGLPSSLFVSGQARWLGVQAYGGSEQPRVMLLSVPYALKAGDAQTLGGRPASAFATASSSNAAGANGVVNNAITGSGTTDYVPLWLSKSKLGSSNIFQSTAGDLGIGTTSPAANLDVNGTSDIRNTLTLFPKGSAPTLSINGTAFEVSNTGTVTFVSGQTFPGTGTVTSVGSGAGLTGGPITTSGALSVATGGVTNTMLQNSSLTVNPGGGMTGGGKISLGGSATLGLENCSANQVLEFVSGAWTCTNAAVGTITGVTAGSGLSGGGTNGNVTLSIPSAGITNAMLANSSLTVNAGTALTGGGVVSLGGSTTLSVDTTKVPLLASANTFTANQSVSGILSATSLSGNGANITNVNASQLGGLGSSAFAQLAASNTFTGNQTVNGSLNLAGVVNASGGFATDNEMFDYGNLGLFNAFLGFAGNLTMTGGQNTASGAFALSGNSIGSNNTASGYWALASNDWGSNNTASGYEAGLPNVYGNNNTFLGANSDPSTGTLTNATAIGANALVSESNALVLGSINGVNGATSNVNVGIGTTSPLSTLDVYGGLVHVLGINPVPSSLVSVQGAYLGWNETDGEGETDFFNNEGLGGGGWYFINTQNSGTYTGWSAYIDSSGNYHSSSSRRWKTNIHTLQGALSKVEQLRGVSYERKDSGRHEIGVIAEEVGQVVPEVVSYEKNGKDAAGVDYSHLTALLIEATKEQQAQIRTQQAKMKAQETRIDEQQGRIRAQAARLEAQQAGSRLQQAQIAELMSQVKAIQATLKTDGRTAGPEVRTVKAQVPMVQQ